MHKSVYNVVLPRFKVDFCVDVRRVLASVGLGDLFDADEVDLEAVVGQKGVAPDLFLHRVVVEADEEAVAEEPEQVPQVSDVHTMDVCRVYTYTTQSVDYSLQLHAGDIA